MVIKYFTSKKKKKMEIGNLNGRRVCSKQKYEWHGVIRKQSGKLITIKKKKKKERKLEI